MFMYHQEDEVEEKAEEKGEEEHEGGEEEYQAYEEEKEREDVLFSYAIKNDETSLGLAFFGHTLEQT